MKARRVGFTLIELMIVIAILAVLMSLAIPGVLGAIRAGNERNASGSLKTLLSAQQTFKNSDMDQNAISDYWTRDVAGLRYVTPAGSSKMIELIPLDIALADGDTVPGGVIYAPPSYHVSSPKSGYWYQMHKYYEEPAGARVSYPFQHPDRWSAIAYPDRYGSSGRLVFILSEHGTQYKRDPGDGNNVCQTFPLKGMGATSAVLVPTYDTFPMDPMTSSPVAVGPWSKLD
jgi:prepilin-type N-terminal cleavage/methylation domain-containing protein